MRGSSGGAKGRPSGEWGIVIGSGWGPNPVGGLHGVRKKPVGKWHMRLCLRISSARFETRRPLSIFVVHGSVKYGVGQDGVSEIRTAKVGKTQVRPE